MKPDSVFTPSEFEAMSDDFRIGAIVADGMWWSIEKWAKHAKVSKDTLQDWIYEHMATGELLQSETGARSYRFPLESIKNWYRSHGYPLDTRLIESLFPPRIWGGLTEIEGFDKAPLREVGTVKFSCSPTVADEVKKALRGIARVREERPGEYRAFALSSSYVKGVITKVFSKYSPSETGGTHSRMIVWRRELVDLPADYAVGLVSFYQKFALTLAKSTMATIKIYLPDYEDQVSQITYWVISSIERFDEKSSVPFSGYLNAVLLRKPYDLTYEHLGKDLADFQRDKSKAVKRLQKERGVESDTTFTHSDLSEAMGLSSRDFSDLESKHRVWLGSKKATSLTWDQSSDEKLVKDNVTSGFESGSAPTDLALAHRLSMSVVQAAIETAKYDDAFDVISQIDASSLDYEKVQSASPEFVTALGRSLGVPE